MYPSAQEIEIKRRIAVIGAGLAGAICAHMLSEAGFQVEVFEKSRGAGGRMATRRAEWADAAGVTHQASFDHGAPAFHVTDAAFAEFLAPARRAGQILPLRPDLADGAAEQRWLAAPDMPALCRSLLDGLTLRTQHTVTAIQHSATGWRLQIAETEAVGEFALVVLAIPPQQAAVLLQQHQPAWAQQASAIEMVPHWTLMAVSSAAVDGAALAQSGSTATGIITLPQVGPLAQLIRNDLKPGRRQLAGRYHWVAHASPAWSLAHLEDHPAQVQAQLQQAVMESTGIALEWQYATVHRWRYATLAAGADGVDALHCWDHATQLGVCGDAWGGGGVQGAWRSAQALARAILEGYPRDTQSVLDAVC